MKKYILFGLLATALPFVAFAANAFSIIAAIQAVLNIIIPLLITIAVVYFIWGVIQYTISQDEEAKKKARSKIIMGLIGLFVIVAFWGIVRVLVNTLGVNPERLPVGGGLPCVPNPVLGFTGGC